MWRLFFPKYWYFQAIFFVLRNLTKNDSFSSGLKFTAAKRCLSHLKYYSWGVIYLAALTFINFVFEVCIRHNYCLDENALFTTSFRYLQDNTVWNIEGPRSDAISYCRKKKYNDSNTLYYESRQHEIWLPLGLKSSRNCFNFHIVMGINEYSILWAPAASFSWLVLFV